MNLDEKQLAKLLATDLNRYFERLVLIYQDQLYAFVMHRVHDAQAAEEIVQLALERAYYALKKYTSLQIEKLHLEPWLYEITRNVFFNHLRGNLRRAARLPSIPFDTSEGSPLLNMEDQSLGPDEEVCRRESQRELAMQVDRLPGHYRETMKLYYFYDLTCREIAERLDQPVGTVKANVHRGTQQLRKALEVEAREVR